MTWTEKFNNPKEIQIKDAPKIWKERFGEKILIPTPKILAEMINDIPFGKLTTLKNIRAELSREYGADFTCPLTTGIFARICAYVSDEEIKAGKSDFVPYWRVVKEDGSLYPKFPGGLEGHAELLKTEGFEIIPKGKNSLKVRNHKSYLY